MRCEFIIVAARADVDEVVRLAFPVTRGDAPVASRATSLAPADDKKRRA